MKGDPSAMTRIHMSRRLALTGATLLGAALLAAGCGGGHDMGNMGSGDSTPTGSSAQGSFNDTDVMFAQGMIPHHQQAVEMADLAATRATDPQVKQLATQIKAAQDPEIKTMTGWLQSWAKPTTMAGGHSMSGMMADDEMAKLKTAKGKDFDRMFAQMMIAHHNGAIQMAGDEQSTGKNADAKALAKNIADSQRAEVATLQKIVDRL
jgi:uncharacterized protein (DUF305 family)